jgi:hypothetical protein
MFRVVPDTGAAFYGAVFVGDAMTRLRSQVPSLSAITYSDARITQLIAARPASISVGPFTMQKAFDFEGRRMYLKPNERLSEAGGRKGDLLLEIDGGTASGP